MKIYFGEMKNILRIMELFIWLGYDPLVNYSEAELQEFRDSITVGTTYGINFKPSRRHAFGKSSHNDMSYIIKSFIHN